MPYAIRTIARERMEEKSTVRSHIPIRARVRSEMAESACVRDVIPLSVLIRMDTNEISAVYKPTILPLPPAKPTFHYAAYTPFNDRWAGLPPVMFDYFMFR